MSLLKSFVASAFDSSSRPSSFVPPRNVRIAPPKIRISARSFSSMRFSSRISMGSSSSSKFSIPKKISFSEAVPVHQKVKLSSIANNTKSMILYEKPEKNFAVQEPKV